MDIKYPQNPDDIKQTLDSDSCSSRFLDEVNEELDCIEDVNIASLTRFAFRLTEWKRSWDESDQLYKFDASYKDAYNKTLRRIQKLGELNKIPICIEFEDSRYDDVLSCNVALKDLERKKRYKLNSLKQDIRIAQYNRIINQKTNEVSEFTIDIKVVEFAIASGNHKVAFKYLMEAFNKINLILKGKNKMKSEFLSDALCDIATCANDLIKAADNNNHYQLAILREMIGDILKLGESNDIQIKIESEVTYTLRLMSAAFGQKYKDCYEVAHGNLYYWNSQGNGSASLCKIDDDSLATEIETKYLSYDAFKRLTKGKYVPTNYNNILDNYVESHNQLQLLNSNNPEIIEHLNKLDKKIFRNTNLYRQARDGIASIADKKNTPQDKLAVFEEYKTKKFINLSTKASILDILTIGTRELRKSDNALDPLPTKLDSTEHRYAIYNSEDGFCASIATMWHAITRKPLDVEEQTNLVANLNSCLNLSEKDKQVLINNIVAEYDGTSCATSDSSAALLNSLNSNLYSSEEKFDMIDSYMLEQFSETNKVLKNNGKRLFIVIHEEIGKIVEPSQNNFNDKDSDEKTVLINGSQREKLNYVNI